MDEPKSMDDVRRDPAAIRQMADGILAHIKECDHGDDAGFMQEVEHTLRVAADALEEAIHRLRERVREG